MSTEVPTNGHEPDKKPMFGSMTPQEAADKSVRVRKERARLGRVKAQDGPRLMKELIAAARGEGVWEKLALDKRLVALIKANEYVNGRPVPMKEADEPEPQRGFSIGLAQMPQLRDETPAPLS